jgi:glucose/arabinose dehydrogenase
MRLRVLVLVVAVLLVGCGDDGASARGAVGLQRIGTFSEPVYVTAPPGDRRRVFVVERGGRIRVLVDGKRRAQPFLDIHGQVSSGGERGLLSLAFAPDHARSGRFYVDYTDKHGDTRIVEYRRQSAERADPASARQLIFQRQPEPNHNGGLLLFGPDRKLYVGFGDGGGGGDQHGAHGNAQNLGTLLGKILRIDPLAAAGRPYGIPSDNPFASRSGARGEIWAYGLRNPWRFAFVPGSGGAMVIGDVGQDAVEEIDVVRGAGANLGWRVFEGRSRYTPGERAAGAIGPALERFHRDGNCSITGGVVVRDRALPALRGRYLFGDYCKGDVQSARVEGRALRGVRSTGIHVDSLSSFGEDGRGRVYAVSLSGGVYRLVQR